MNLKGQGALEYLLLIGGAVLVAAIVIALVTGIPTSQPNPAVAAACASQTSCPTCIIEDVAGTPVGADCSARGSDGIDYTSCTLPAGVTFHGCVPR